VTKVVPEGHTRSLTPSNGKIPVSFPEWEPEPDASRTYRIVNEQTAVRRGVPNLGTDIPKKGRLATAADVTPDSSKLLRQAGCRATGLSRRLPKGGLWNLVPGRFALVGFFNPGVRGISEPGFFDSASACRPVKPDGSCKLGQALAVNERPTIPVFGFIKTHASERLIAITLRARHPLAGDGGISG
jgi:hypothetical protein